MANSTMVMEFVLLGSPDGWELSFLYFIVLLLTYLSTLLGNLLIITVTSADQNLHMPLYFFLRSLSILDMCFISITVPNACINTLTSNMDISVAGCAAPIFLAIFCACVELLFLSIMAWDHYVAICQSLQYPIMNPQLCVRMTLAFLLSDLVYACVQTGHTFWLSFCQSNMVHQFFCDVPSLLSCYDTTSNMVLILLSAVVVWDVNQNLQNMANSNMVMEFLLVGSPDGWNMSFLYFMVFILTYLSTLLGNLLIVTVTTVDQNLHTPMYFFLRILSIVDMYFISVTVPNAWVNSITENRAISKAGCAPQIFLVILSACVELLFLSLMAWDC
ncbi:Olfactory receptor 14C36 [Sciurus carolinensis]|uniref:Olfactory receptor 14C36 n=1 Tax=Sciurus carolinensis TaxID=30640 RepID=A0AA41NJH2_SCICA|nr:Olfactory receptor 14C36 [Sciurus carolinensis]